MQNKLIFIIPYYGKLPCFFNAWLISAKYQKNIDFLLVTDLIEKEPADNIHILYQSFDDTKKLFQSKFDFKISLDKPYKFCDFRPAYGYIFSDYIQNYEFWGHCDIDTIFGDLEKYLFPIMKKYDAIGKWGHLSIYKNIPMLNNLFIDNNSLYNYKEVFSSELNFAFDETSGMKNICKINNSIKYFPELTYIADVRTCYKNITLKKELNKNKQAFFFENGKLIQCYLENDKISYSELIYLHFQRKNPSCFSGIENAKSFYIFGNEFVERVSNKTDLDAIKRNYKNQFSKFCEYFFWILKKISDERKLSPEQRKILILKRKNEKRKLFLG